MRALELWGGHECTVNRLGDVFHDQTLRSGHHERLDDLDRFAALGLTALRYPLLWERIAARAPNERDWAWTDARLGRMRDLGLRPIAGLLHHGSGPRYTSLVDPAFPGLFADFARAAAERYPWVRDWTPVNEPLTTARFSALYGHWHPHGADEALMWAALINQVEATAAAMREIRAVIPRARLIQTEDLGRTYSTPETADQAGFDNDRRWMTWDLLSGLVVPGHALWKRLEGLGFGDRLARLADAPCPPDVIGVNHYLTSDRFLDHRIERYPPERSGGNGRIAYADLEAVRVVLPAPGGLEGALAEAWARYGVRLAVTECHNGCTREEQVRWLREAWETAGRLRAGGVGVEAVTAWALLGAYDWNSLLTRHVGCYEPGAFDVRDGAPRPTAIAREIARLARGGMEPAHPATLGPGWWRRDIRLAFQPVIRAHGPHEPRAVRVAEPAAPQPLLILGQGPLARELVRACDWRGIDCDLGEAAAADLDAIRPWAVVDADGPRLAIARACAARGLAYVAAEGEPHAILDRLIDGEPGGRVANDDEVVAIGRAVEPEVLG